MDPTKTTWHDRRVLLVGCVKTKRPVAAPAEDLYNSPLFSRRKRYAHASGHPWYVLSSRWGLIHPEELIAPYELYMGDTSTAYRAAWAGFVRAQLESRMSLGGTTFEIHAGRTYIDPLRPVLEAAGARVEAPVQVHSQGEMLAWYDHNEPSAAEETDRFDGQTARPGSASPVEGLVRQLLDGDEAVPATQLRSWSRTDLAGCGMYSSWADPAGAAELAAGLGHEVMPGLIYAGQGGATRWPSGKASGNNLYGRLLGMHLNGNIEFSTFRLTLMSVLRLGDEQRLSEWMDQHLSVVVVPWDDADTLGAVEGAVLNVMDPPSTWPGGH